MEGIHPISQCEHKTPLKYTGTTSPQSAHLHSKHKGQRYATHREILDPSIRVVLGADHNRLECGEPKNWLYHRVSGQKGCCLHIIASNRIGLRYPSIRRRARVEPMQSLGLLPPCIDTTRAWL